MDGQCPEDAAEVEADLFLSPDGFQPPHGCAAGGGRTTSISTPSRAASLSPGIVAVGSPAARSALATVSRYSADDIADQYGVDPDRIDVVYNGAAPRTTPLASMPSKAGIRNRTGGQPFFVFIGTNIPGNLEGLLDALRYRNRGGQWDLLLVARPSGASGSTRKPWTCGRRREGPYPPVGGPPDELASVLAAAEGLVFIPWFGGSGFPCWSLRPEPQPSIGRTSLPEVSLERGKWTRAMPRWWRRPCFASSASRSRERLVEQGTTAPRPSAGVDGLPDAGLSVRAGGAGVPLGTKSEYEFGLRTFLVDGRVKAGWTKPGGGCLGTGHRGSRHSPSGGYPLARSGARRQ